MKSELEKVRQKALDIVSFNNVNYNGGNKCTHKTSVYGKIFKYIFAEREWTFAFAGQLLGTTGQNVNYIVNRMPEERFSNVYLRRLCGKLSVDYEEFSDLAEAIKTMG
jgi:hypothetical protein